MRDYWDTSIVDNDREELEAIRESSTRRERVDPNGDYDPADERFEVEA